MTDNKAHVSLDTLLDCLPLVYNPTTKSLQLISTNHNSTKSVISNGGVHNCSITPSEYQNSFVSVSNKFKVLEEPTNYGDDEVDIPCSSLFCKVSPISEHNHIENSACRFPVPNGNFTECATIDSDCDSMVSVADSTRDIAIPKVKGGFSFISDLLGRKNGAATSDSLAVNASPVSNSCYSWKRLSRSYGKNSKVEEVQAGSTGLIMGKRPPNVPAKNSMEEESHKKQHHDIVHAYKKKELKEAKEKKKLKCIQLKHEQQLTESVSVWKTDIIPNWETMKCNKKTIDLWWQGIPSCVRGKVWKLTIGNDLNMSPVLFQSFIKRSEEKLNNLNKEKYEIWDACKRSSPMTGDHEATIEFIKLDVSRTFPHLGIFQKGGPMHDTVHDILSAFVSYRPDVGYVQGMSFLAAMLLLNLPDDDAFVAFANLVCRPPHIHFFSIDQMSMKSYYSTFNDLLAESMPELFDHFYGLKVTPDMYLMDWVLSLFSRSLPLDVASRLWDVYLRDGQCFIFQAALGILKLYEPTLLAQECTVLCGQFLTSLRDDLDVDDLFRAIASIQAIVSEASFLRRLHTHMQLSRLS